MNATTYPEQPGFKASGTSQEAAESVTGRAELLRTLCLTAVQHKPMTADECANDVREDKLSVRPRFSELKRMGKIVDSGERRKNDSGKSATVWKAVGA